MRKGYLAPSVTREQIKIEMNISSHNMYCLEISWWDQNVPERYHEWLGRSVTRLWRRDIDVEPVREEHGFFWQCGSYQPENGYHMFEKWVGDDLPSDEWLDEIRKKFWQYFLGISGER